jgi:hypothetical protein
MLNPISDTYAAIGALDQASHVFKEAPSHNRNNIVLIEKKLYVFIFLVVVLPFARLFI